MSRSNAVLHRPGVLADATGRYRATLNTLATVVSIFGAPLAPIAYLATRWYQRRFHETLEVFLTRRDLVVRMGVWYRQEKSIPLEKITDVALLEGPLMRRFGVKGLRVETAGQVSGGLGLVNLVGIANPETFRDQVLAQRDRISDGEERPGRPTPPNGGPRGPAAPGDAESADTPTRLPPRRPGAVGAPPVRGGEEEITLILREIRDLLRGFEERSRP